VGLRVVGTKEQGPRGGRVQGQRERGYRRASRERVRQGGGCGDQWVEPRAADQGSGTTTGHHVPFKWFCNSLVLDTPSWVPVTANAGAFAGSTTNLVQRRAS